MTKEIRRNRFNGESVELTAEEADKHDKIFYHEAMAPVLVNVIWMGMNTVGIFEGISNMQALAEMSKVIS